MAAALFFWAVLGGLVGGFAKSVFWYEGPQGWGPCILFGVAGAIAGAFVRGTANAFELGSMALAVVGAAVVLSLYNLLSRRAHATNLAGRRAA